MVERLLFMNQKNIFILLLLFLIVLTTVFFGGSYLIRNSLQDFIVKPISSITPEPGTTATATPTPDPLRPFSILLLGYGGSKHQGGYLTDSMILLRIEPKNRKSQLISIPRDLWVNLPITPATNKAFKINAAYAIGNDHRNYPAKPVQFTGAAGGGVMAKYAVEQTLGIRPDYFISLDFDGFVNAIDALGGVDVNVPQTFSDPWYPLPDKQSDPCGKSEDDIKNTMATLSGELLEHEFPCRYETLSFTKGEVQMDGTTALKFVRSRHSPTGGNDFGRSQRQRALLTAVRDKVFEIGFITKVIPFLASFKGNLLTDLSENDIKRLIGITRDLNNYSISTIALTTSNVLKEAVSEDHQYVLTGLDGPFVWTKVHEYISRELASPSAQPR